MKIKDINAAAIFKEIGKIEVFDPFYSKKKATILSITQQLLLDIDKARNWPSSKIFCRLVDEFTMRAAKGETGSKLSDFFNKSPGVNIWSLDQNDFRKIFRGKRFADSDADVALKVGTVFRDKYAGNWKKYFDEAERQKERNNFKEDPFLKIKGVGFKTRDLGLESFSRNFIAIDRHIKRALFRTGLILKGYEYGIELPSGADADKDYLNFASICRKISKEAKISLVEIDKYLWFLGREFCGSEPKCDRCPLAVGKLCAFKSGIVKNNTKK